MKTEAKVGAFVLAAFAVLLITIYRVSTATIRGAHASYKTYFRYAGGLEPGADVLFGGIKVGNVTAVRPDTEDPTRILILMDVKHGTPLNKNSVAKLGSVTLVSSPVISISTGSNDAPRLPPGGVVPSQETISLDDMERKFSTLADSAQSLVSSAKGDIDKTTHDARHLLANLNRITAEQNQQHIRTLLANLNGMVDRLSPQIDEIMKKVGPTVDNANATISNANETITKLRGPTQKDLEDLNRTIEQAQGLIVDLRTAIRVKDQDLTYTLENVRAISENLNEMTDSLKQRPWSLIRIRQPKDRQVPKASRARKTP